MIHNHLRPCESIQREVYGNMMKEEMVESEKFSELSHEFFAS